MNENQKASTIHNIALLCLTILGCIAGVSWAFWVMVVINLIVSVSFVVTTLNREAMLKVVASYLADTHAPFIVDLLYYIGVVTITASTGFWWLSALLILQAAIDFRFRHLADFVRLNSVEVPEEKEATPE